MTDDVKVSKLEYLIIKESFFDEDNGGYISYGMNVLEEGRCVRKISDISTSFMFVEELCDKCNRLDVSLEQIDYIIEDMLP